MADPVLTPTYDELPCVNKPFPQTHPDRLATLARLFGLQPPGSIDAIQNRHLQVHQDDIGTQITCQPESFFTIRRFADNFQIGLQ